MLFKTKKITIVLPKINPFTLSTIVAVSNLEHPDGILIIIWHEQNKGGK